MSLILAFFSSRLQRLEFLEVTPILGRWPRLLHFAPSALRAVAFFGNFATILGVTDSHRGLTSQGDYEL